MKNYILTLFLVVFSLNLFAQELDQMRFRSLVNLSNYIANDYVNAIEDGIIINEFEYAEMLEFADELQLIHADLKANLSSTDFPSYISDIDILEEKIIAKESPKEIKNIANQLSQDLLALGILNNVPSTYPDIANGKVLYKNNCQYCHGKKGLGDGLSAKGLNPAPSNFLESQHIFPFHIYNTVQLGIEGTSMAPQQHLTESETWDLAFYVMTLTYEDTLVNENFANEARSKVDLALLSNASNKEIEQIFTTNAFEKVKALRFFEGVHSKETSLDLTLEMLQESIALYQNNDFDGATQKALNAYFVGFEPVERELGATNPSKVTLIEKEMMVFRSYLAKGGNKASLEEQYEKIAYHFGIIKSEKGKNSFWDIFLYSIAILIREGLEALLIIVAILAALNSFKEGEKAKIYVHSGWIIAVVLGVISFFFVGKLIDMGSHMRELLEGFGALLAVVILLSVSFWLHDKSNAVSWSRYVREKLSKHLSSNSLWSVAILSFIVVFREAFESVIFLSSLTMSGGKESGWAVLAGTVFSALIIIVAGLAIIRFSKRLPIQQVFKISSITMLILAVILAGKGLKELQEAGFVGVDLLGFRASVDFLGFYPTYQTIGAQLLALAIALLLWYVNKRKTKTITVQAVSTDNV